MASPLFHFPWLVLHTGLTHTQSVDFSCFCVYEDGCCINGLLVKVSALSAEPRVQILHPPLKLIVRVFFRVLRFFSPLHYWVMVSANKIKQK